MSLEATRIALRTAKGSFSERFRGRFPCVRSW